METELRFVSVSSGALGTCAVATPAGAPNPRHHAYCWGFYLGNPEARTPDEEATPYRVSSRPLWGVHTGGDFACGVEETSGTGFCWGANMAGQLGNGTSGAQFTTIPQRVDGTGSGHSGFPAQRPLRSLSLSRENTLAGFACALTESGQTLCWGANDHGQLGRRTDTVCRISLQETGLTIPCGPVADPQANGHRFESLALGRSHACGVTGANAVYCWGRGSEGQLGNGLFASSTTPVRVEFLSDS